MAQTQLVLWDWNGTLLNDLQLSIQALNRLLAGCSPVEPG